MYGFIYITTNNINGKRYIGQRKYDKQGKWKEYLGSGINITRAIKKYGSENFSKEIIEECKSKKELNEKEIFWIEFYNAVESNEFYNIARGGDGGVTVKGEKHHLSKIVYQYELETGLLCGEWENAQRASEKLNICVSDIHASCNGKKGVKRAGNYMWRYYKVDKICPYVREGVSKIPILQLDKDFNIIKRYNNISYIDSKQYNKEKVTNCCRRKIQYSHKNYYWVYEKDFNSEYIEYINTQINKNRNCTNNKEILQIKDGRLIQKFRTAKEAEQCTGIKSGTIQAYCKRGLADYGKKSKYGFEWRYCRT